MPRWAMLKSGQAQAVPMMVLQLQLLVQLTNRAGELQETADSEVAAHLCLGGENPLAGIAQVALYTDG